MTTTAPNGTDRRAPDGPGEIVRAFFERMEARDWEGAAELVADDITVRWTATDEQFDGDNFVAMNRAYPEGWHIEVVEVLADGSRVAAQVTVDHDCTRFWCAGFYTVEHGRIRRATEHWLTEGGSEPPQWRNRFTT